MRTLPVVILAGGRGTRLAAITGDALPKPLVPVNDRPFLDYKLTGLAAVGVTDVLLLVGHHGEQIIDHVGDGSAFGLRTRCIADDEGGQLLGTGGALRVVLAELADAFWVTYADTYLQVDLHSAEERFTEATPSAHGLMTVLHNRDLWEPSNVALIGDRVASYRKNPPPGTHEYIDYGMLILERVAIEACTVPAPFDLAAILEPLIQRRELLGFEVTERFHDVGTAEALAETADWLLQRPPTTTPE